MKALIMLCLVMGWVLFGLSQITDERMVKAGLFGGSLASFVVSAAACLIEMCK